MYSSRWFARSACGASGRPRTCAATCARTRANAPSPATCAGAASRSSTLCCATARSTRTTRAAARTSPPPAEMKRAHPRPTTPNPQTAPSIPAMHRPITARQPRRTHYRLMDTKWPSTKTYLQTSPTMLITTTRLLRKTTKGNSSYKTLKTTTSRASGIPWMITKARRMRWRLVMISSVISWASVISG